MIDIEQEIKQLTEKFLKESLQIISANAIAFSNDIGKTAALYCYYKKIDEIVKAEKTLMHLKSQCLSLSTIVSIQEAKKIEKLLWLSLDVILKFAIKAIL